MGPSRPPRPRPRLRVRLLTGAVVAFAIANALAACEFPPPGEPVRPAPRSPRDFGRPIRFLIANAIAATGVGYVIAARHLEHSRRRRLGLPPGLREQSAYPGPSSGPRPAGKHCRYRPYPPAPHFLGRGR
jgi:hypothetical protein